MTHFYSPEEKINQTAREKNLFLYASALERGDLKTTQSMLERAQSDAKLEAMIRQMHELEIAEESASEHETIAVQVRDLLAQHLPSARILSAHDVLESEDDLPPVTVADVASRLQSDAASGLVQRRVLGLASSALWQRLQNLREPLPEQFNARSLAQFFEKLGVQCNEKFQDAFGDTAQLLQMGRQQNRAQLAATRRIKSSPVKAQKSDDGENTKQQNSEKAQEETAQEETA